MAEKFEKFGFEADFFDVTNLDGLVSAPKLPRNLQEARDEGYREGLAKGRAEGEAVLQQELARLTQAVQSLTGQLSRQHTAWQEQLTTQALSLLRVSLHRLVGEAAAQYSDLMLEHHLRDLLKLLHQGEGLTLRVHPQARHYHEKLGLPQASIANMPFKIVTDPTLGPTDVVIAWPGGGLESLLPQHLAALDALLAAAGARPLPVPPPPEQSRLPAPEPASPLGEAVSQSKSRAAELLGDDDLVDALK